MGKNNDKSLVTKIAIACLIIIAGAQIAFILCSEGNFSNPVFWIVDIVLALFFAYAVNSAYKNVDTEKDNITRAFIIAITVIMICWAGGWAIAGNEKVAPGSPQMSGNIKLTPVESMVVMEAINYTIANGGGAISLPNGYYLSINAIQ